MNQCNGNGLCGLDTGACICYSIAWKGGDCGLFSHLLGNSTGNLEITNDSVGPTWFSYTYDHTIHANNIADYFIISTSNVDIDVYIGYGVNSDPNKYSHDMKFIGINSDSDLYLRLKNLPILLNGFTISIYVNGLENKTNTLMTNRVTLGEYIS
jgi:hypothetical protein